MIHPLLSPPPRADWPTLFPDPLSVEPHPLAMRAVQALKEALDSRRLGLAHEALWAPGGGKMFGVLVVADGDELGWLAAFSGKWGQWTVEGFVPPLFDDAALETFWPQGLADLAALTAAVDARRPAVEAIEAQRAALISELEAGRAALLAAQQGARDLRRQQRAALQAQPASPEVESALKALARASSQEKAERKAYSKAQAEALQAIDHSLALAKAELERVVKAREARSFGLQIQLHDAHHVTNALGERGSLVDLFAPDLPPGGTGDCAAPKLLGYAYAHGLRPLALAEFWWGAPPPGGGRQAGQIYPPCRSKCGPLIPWMLRGLPVLRGEAPGASPPELPLEIIYEDDWIIAVHKPAGLLSVPGRDPALADSVERRLQAHWPDLKVAHRLDLDTSGLLLAAKTPAALSALHGQFRDRLVRKVYRAWVAGQITGQGRIELPLSPDLSDRPRQRVDAEGRPAITLWRALEGTDRHTLLELRPITGRTHQLRVHAAHGDGLGAPIVGDRLYGRRGARLLLHACALRFRHPETGSVILLDCPPPADFGP